jgi:hypothetical protein
MDGTARVLLAALQVHHGVVVGGGDCWYNYQLNNSHITTVFQEEQHLTPMSYSSQTSPPDPSTAFGNVLIIAITNCFEAP